MIEISDNNTKINGCPSLEEFRILCLNALDGIDAICRYRGKNIKAWEDLSNMKIYIEMNLETSYRIKEVDGKLCVMGKNECIDYLKTKIDNATDGNELYRLYKALRDVKNTNESELYSQISVEN